MTFIDIPDAPETPIVADQRTQLIADIQTARARGYSQSVLRGLDMLLKLDGLYGREAAQDARTTLPDAQVAQSLAECLLPCLRPLLAPGKEAELAGAVRLALTEK